MVDSILRHRMHQVLRYIKNPLFKIEGLLYLTFGYPKYNHLTHPPNTTISNSSPPHPPPRSVIIRLNALSTSLHPPLPPNLHISPLNP